jgi:hypothetical protein
MRAYFTAVVFDHLSNLPTFSHFGGVE